MEQVGMAKAPLNHQAVIRSLIVNLSYTLDEAEYIALPEPNAADADPLTLIPDVIVFNRETEEPVVGFEVEKKGNYKAAIEKAKRLISRFYLIEVFVLAYVPEGNFDYEISNVYRINKSGVDRETYSEALEIDVSDMY